MRTWLRNLRVDKKMTQEDMAQQVGVDLTSIGKYELGIRRPTVETAKKIANILDFDWTRLFIEENSVNDEDQAS